MKKNFFQQIKQIDKDKIISIDETAIYLNSKNNYGWAKKGSKCIIKEKNKKIYQKRYSLLMAISNKKIISYVIYEKSINGEQFLDFIKKIKNLCKHDTTLLMDNATIHKTKKFKKYCDEKKINILYNIPYNPESNPIEMIFCPLKRFIKSKNTKSVSIITKSIEQYVQTVKSKTLKAMFDKALDNY